MPKPKTIELSPEDLQALLERVKTVVLEEDYEIIKAMTEALQAMSQVVDHKAASIKRLLKQLFGQKSEKKKLFSMIRRATRMMERIPILKTTLMSPTLKRKRNPRKNQKGMVATVYPLIPARKRYK